MSRNTVRKIIRSGATEFEYERRVQPQPKIGPWRDDLDRLLATNAARPARERLTLTRIFEELRGLGYDGSYDAVRRYAAGWRRRQSEATAAAFVPLRFEPGEAYQFDWSHEVVLIDGVTVTVKVAHVRLCHSRMMFVRAYPRETQAPSGPSLCLKHSPGAFHPGEPGPRRKGVRRPRPGLRLLQGRLYARDLRQHEDGGGRDLRRQEADLQPPVRADVQSLSGRPGRLHPGLRLGEGAGREPGGHCPAALRRAASTPPA